MSQKKPVQHIRNPFNQRGATILFAFLGIVLFTYPFLVFNKPSQIFYSLFLAWSGAVAVLYLMSRKSTEVITVDEDEQIEGERDNV